MLTLAVEAGAGPMFAYQYRLALMLRVLLLYFYCTLMLYYNVCCPDPVHCLEIYNYNWRCKGLGLVYFNWRLRGHCTKDDLFCRKGTNVRCTLHHM